MHPYKHIYLSVCLSLSLFQNPWVHMDNFYYKATSHGLFSPLPFYIYVPLSCQWEILLQLFSVYLLIGSISLYITISFSCGLSPSPSWCTRAVLQVLQNSPPSLVRVPLDARKTIWEFLKGDALKVRGLFIFLSNYSVWRIFWKEDLLHLSLHL